MAMASLRTEGLHNGTSRGLVLNHNQDDYVTLALDGVYEYVSGLS